MVEKWGWMRNIWSAVEHWYCSDGAKRSVKCNRVASMQGKTKLNLSKKEGKRDIKDERLEPEELDIFNYRKECKPYFHPYISQQLRDSYYPLKLPLTNYDQLHALLSKTFNHAKRRNNIFTWVDRHPDYTLRCVYSGTILSDSEGYILNKFNEEHSYPQSYQSEAKKSSQKTEHFSGSGQDMHAIFAASTTMNYARENIPFGKSGVLIKSLNVGNIYKQGSTKYFQPALNKGALARATLYMLVCYKHRANENYLPKKSLEWLVEAATSDAITDWERHRNEALHELQGNRNPFIDFPQLALLVDFSAGWQPKE